MAVSITDLSLIKEWLVQGSDEPESFVDMKWQVIDERVEDGKLTALRVTYPNTPVNLVVVDMENPDVKIKAFRMVIETGIRLLDLSPNTKFEVYRVLLDLSMIPLVKLYVFGEDQEIGVAVDLDKKSLSKEEFNEALAALLAGYRALVEMLPRDLKEEASEEALLVIYKLVENWYRSGVSRESAYRSLVKAGLDEEFAGRLVDLIYGGGSGGDTTHTII